MPLDVCDKSGKHIGVILDKYPYDTNACMVALTEQTAAELDTNMHEIKNFLHQYMED